MPVYVDVLLIVNGFVNYLMLVISKNYLKFNTKSLRILAASSLGSLFSLKIFLPEIPLLFELILRAVMCGAISFSAFGFINVKTFFRNSCVFFTVNLLFGGLMCAVLFFFNTDMMLYKNGAVYFDIDLKILAVTSVASFAAVNAVSMIISRKAPSETICFVTVITGEKSVSGRGFFDTGNGLKEIFSGFPVIVAQYDAAKDIIPAEIKAYFKNRDIKAVSGNIRFIPAQSMSGTEILPSFKPDSVTIKSRDSERIVKDVYIAVSRQSFFGGEFEFIINNELTGENFHESARKAEAAAFEKNI